MCRTEKRRINVEESSCQVHERNILPPINDGINQPGHWYPQLHVPRWLESSGPLWLKLSSGSTRHTGSQGIPASHCIDRSCLSGRNLLSREEGALRPLTSLASRSCLLMRSLLSRAAALHSRYSTMSASSLAPAVSSPFTRAVVNAMRKLYVCDIGLNGYIIQLHQGAPWSLSPAMCLLLNDND